MTELTGRVDEVSRFFDQGRCPEMSQPMRVQVLNTRGAADLPGRFPHGLRRYGARRLAPREENPFRRDESNAPRHERGQARTHVDVPDVPRFRRADFPVNVRPRDAEASLLHEDVVTLQGAHFADPAAGEGE